jgi:molybdate transport system substrate-binding protein
MLKKTFLLPLLAINTLLLPAQPKITVAAAANMQYAMQELVAEFNKTDRAKIAVVLGASGKLTQQIQNGAPFDIFVSADKEFPQKLANNKLTLEAPKVYAQGLLVLWSVKPNIQPATDLKLLLSANIKSIAIANPRTAPYGSAAESILKKYGLYEKVSSKLVTGESVSQTSQFIVTQNADIGFTARAIVISKEMQGRGKWVELNSRDYPPIEQSAVLLKHAKQNNEAAVRKFYTFLYSAKAKAIYNKYGYIVK